MRFSAFLFAAAILPAALVAQTNTIELWPGVTNFTSRGSLGTGSGELLQGLHTSAFTGIGDDGTAAKITGFRMILQDQNTDTREDYRIIYRNGTDAAGPVTGASGINCRLGPFTSPPRGTGGPIQANIITQTFTSTKCLELCKYVAFGVELEPARNWTMDGVSVHISRGDGAFAGSVQRAASTAPDFAWQIINGTKSQPSLKRSWRFTILTDAATLQMGNGGSRYGQGGPNPATGVPFSARAQYGATSGVDDSWIFLSDKIICPGVRIYPGMRVYLGSFHGPWVVPVPASGQATHALGTTPSTSPKLTLHFQAVGLIKASGSCVITNACSTNF